jgi:hypothetical protein
MKNNIQALTDALKQADDGEFVSHFDSDTIPSIRIDGYWEGEPLEGAITTHLVPLASLVKEQSPAGMYLRTGIVEGETHDGRPFELSLLASGRALVFSIGNYGGEDRRTQILGFEDLVEGWLRINQEDS